MTHTTTVIEANTDLLELVANTNYDKGTLEGFKAEQARLMGTEYKPNTNAVTFADGERSMTIGVINNNRKTKRLNALATMIEQYETTIADRERRIAAIIRTTQTEVEPVEIEEDFDPFAWLDA